MESNSDSAARHKKYLEEMIASDACKKLKAGDLVDVKHYYSTYSKRYLVIRVADDAVYGIYVTKKGSTKPKILQLVKNNKHELMQDASNFRWPVVRFVDADEMHAKVFLVKRHAVSFPNRRI